MRRPAKEDMEPYIRVAAMLVDVGVNAPRVLERNDEQGFLLTPISARGRICGAGCQGDADRCTPTRSMRWCASSRAARAHAARCRRTTTRCCGARWDCSRNGSAAGISA